MKLKKTYFFLLTLSILLFTFSLVCNLKHHKFSSSNVKSNIGIFSSSTYSGRLPGTKENMLVGETIRKEFQDSGLKPFNSDSYKENFTVVCPSNNYTASELNISSNDEIIHSFVYGKDFKEDMLNFAESSVSFSNTDKVNIYTNSIEVLKDNKAYLLFVPRDDELSFRSSFMTDCAYSFTIMITSDAYSRIVNYINEGNSVSINLPFSTTKESISNIIGYIPGRSESLPPLVLTAHYDHLGTDGLGNIYPGALDNASGTSFLLELQKTFSSYGKPQRDIIFVAFNAEEFGLLGSSYFVNNNLDSLQNAEVINFDMVGSTNYPISFMLGGKSLKTDSELLNSLKNICDSKSQKYSVEYKDASDHAPFSNKNIDSLTVSHSDTSKIHTPNDRVEYISTEAIESIYTVIDTKVKDYAYDNITIFIYSINSLIIFSFLLGFIVSIPIINKVKSKILNKNT